MIGFDLDGVLMPDMRFLPDRKHLINTVREWMLPLYQPVGEWCLITSRHPDDAILVANWVKENFRVQPRFIEHYCIPGMDPAAYKARVLDRLPQIRVYVESDPDTARRIREEMTRTNVRVVVFQDLISGGL